MGVVVAEEETPAHAWQHGLDRSSENGDGAINSFKGERTVRPLLYKKDERKAAGNLTAVNCDPATCRSIACVHMPSLQSSESQMRDRAAHFLLSTKSGSVCSKKKRMNNKKDPNIIRTLFDKNFSTNISITARVCKQERLRCVASEENRVKR